jgi:hypothetical protein
MDKPKCSFDENALLLSVHCTLHLVSSLKIKANIKKKKVEKSGPHRSTKYKLNMNTMYFIFDSQTHAVIKVKQ